MIPIASGVKVWIATGHTDMRRGMNPLALLVQEAFARDPHGGDLYVFRGRSGKLKPSTTPATSAIVSSKNGSPTTSTLAALSSAAAPARPRLSTDRLRLN